MSAEVAEWTKAPALRAGVPMGRKGSNPFLGVRKWRRMGVFARGCEACLQLKMRGERNDEI